jgi:soluble lytic murein transglycosylase
LLELGRQRNWRLFNEELPKFRMNDDREVKCYAIVAQNRVTSSYVAQELRDLWLAQRSADDGCSHAAETLLKAGTLSEEAVWERARLAMERGHQSVATQAVRMINKERARQVPSIFEKPERYLDEKVTAVRQQTKEMVTLALVRLATRDPIAAAQHAERMRWRTQLTAEERSWIWGSIGHRSALRLDPNALTYFKKADVASLPRHHLAWKTRAALRAEEWSLVYDTIQAMESSQRAEPVWTYWLARAVDTRNTPDARALSRRLMESIAGTTGFYEQLAMEATGQRITAPAAPAPLTAAEIAGARNNPGLIRALRAFEMDLRTEAIREWNYTVALHTPGGMSDRELLAAAELACQRQIWDRCINTSKRTRESIHAAQRFPKPFREQVLARSQATGIDPAFVYGLIRQESRFITHARSHVGASGLMQIMPATASWTARRIGLRDFKPQQINDIHTNLSIGTAYLKLALDDFEGSIPMAVAAYNAGPSRPRSWRNGPVLEAAIWIENIPFDETRDYVKRVMSNTVNYAALITGQPQSLNAKLQPIGPRAATAQAPNTDLP